MSGGGSKEQELLSIQTYSGKEIGKVNSDATKDEIQAFIQETTDNKSHVQLMQTEEAILFGFIDNRHALLEWEKAALFRWSLKLPTNKWQKCTFEGTTLIELKCSYNQLTTLPDLRQCVSLKKLDCSANQLTELPDLRLCVSLEYLDCSYNQLTELPDLFQCVSLEKLYCFYNQLTELPDLFQCVSLEKLYCFYNQFIELPDLRPCVSLKELYCSDNQLIEEPKVLPGVKVSS
jgi:hypothetical protein